MLGAFWWSACISFVGSLVPGMLTARLAELSSKQLPIIYVLGYAWGCALAETPAAFLALRLVDFAKELKAYYPFLYLLMAFFLVLLAVPRMRCCVAWARPLSGWPSYCIGGFWLGLANLMPFPFWLGITSYLQSHTDLLATNAWAAYIFGIFIGTAAFLSLWVLGCYGLTTNMGGLFWRVFYRKGTPNRWIKSLPIKGMYRLLYLVLAGWFLFRFIQLVL